MEDEYAFLVTWYRNTYAVDRNGVVCIHKAIAEKGISKTASSNNKHTHYPESKPDDLGWQGLAKVDCVAEWSPCWNSNVTVSPGDAVTVVGLKVSPLPTTTVCEVLVPLDDDEGDEDGEDELVLPIAADWKAENFDPGFTANTMPAWQ